MKLAIAIIFALVCSTIAEDVVKACQDTGHFWDGTKCTACTDGCKACVGKGGKQSCLDCPSAKFLSIDSELGTCKACIDNCAACRGAAAGDCAVPNTDFTVSPSGLFKCAGLTGCQYCSAEGKCGKCQPGYNLKEDKCTPCTDKSCLECAADVAKCTKCAYWNKIDKDACVACDALCKDCPCTSCLSGSFKDGKCTPCSGNGCIECSADAAKCTKCFGGFFLKDAACTQCDVANCIECTGAGQCSKCQNKYGLKESKTCTKCPDNCETCDGEGKCSKCADGTYPKENTCTPCGTGCDGCGTDGTCSKCKAGYFIEDGKKSCKLCTDANCKECAEATKCKTCIDSALLITKDSTCKAFTSCNFGQALKDDGTCVAGTIENCGWGNAAGSSCGVCAPGFYAKDKACSACPNGCKACGPDAKGYVRCTDQGQAGFSIVNDTNGKVDKSGYLGKDLVYTLAYNGGDQTCMPNSWTATYTLDNTKHKCLALDACPRISGTQGAFKCQIEGNAVKMTLSLFAVVVATLFTL